jgi:type I restriction enzyme R subunit
VIEELIEMAKKFRRRQAGARAGPERRRGALLRRAGQQRIGGARTVRRDLKKIAHELTENLRQNVTVDWSVRESVRARLRLMVKRILRKYKYPPDQQEGAVELVLQQALWCSVGFWCREENALFPLCRSAQLQR